MSSERIIPAVELWPVVEVEPVGAGRSLPRGSCEENPDGWEEYWKECIAAQGFPKLQAIEPGSWLVSVSSFPDDAIDALLASNFDKLPAADRATMTSPLAGGFALRADGQHLVLPTCCGDLGNLSEWDRAADYRESDWRMLWIGHPWVSVRFDDDYLVVSNYHEAESPEGAFRLEPARLKGSVEPARIMLAAFTQRLESRLQRRGLSSLEAKAMAHRMTG